MVRLGRNEDASTQNVVLGGLFFDVHFLSLPKKRRRDEDETGADKLAPRPADKHGGLPLGSARPDNPAASFGIGCNSENKKHSATWMRARSMSLAG